VPRWHFSIKNLLNKTARLFDDGSIDFELENGRRTKVLTSKTLSFFVFAFLFKNSDPADGSVAEAAPLGDDTQLLDDAMKVFSNATAIEMINGRVAQIGWMAALYTEITQNKSLWGQVFSTRTFTLADGVSDTVTYPGAGLFLAPFCGIFILAASLAPVLKKSSPDGVTAPGNALGPFKPEAELTNGRGAMVGLVALLLAEKFTNGNPLF
jgi:hypothetical protein